MATRLERHVQRGSSGRGRRASSAIDLGVRPAKSLVMAGSHELVFVNHDGADQRVWLDRTQALGGLEQSETHPLDVFILRDVWLHSRRLGILEGRFR